MDGVVAGGLKLVSQAHDVTVLRKCVAEMRPSVDSWHSCRRYSDSGMCCSIVFFSRLGSWRAQLSGNALPFLTKK